MSFVPGPTSLESTNVQAALEELDARVQALASDGATLSTRVASLEGEVEIDLVPIPAGQFVMGSPESEVGRNRPLMFIRSADWRFANQAHERGNVFFSIGFRVVLDSGA